MAYGKMGFVTDEKQNIVWDRINRRNISNIKSPVEEIRKVTKYLEEFTGGRIYGDGLLVINASGCALVWEMIFVRP